VPSTLHEVFKQIFKKMEEWNQDWHCENTMMCCNEYTTVGHCLVTRKIYSVGLN
jgi:hypothetical protein